MCNFQNLYLGAEGYIIRCHSCNNFQIAFQTSLLTFSVDEYCNFHQQLKKSCENHDDCVDCNYKSIYLTSPTTGFGLVLNKIEALMLLSMFDKADTEFKSQELIQLFNVSNN